MSEPRKSRLEVEEIGDVTVVNFVDRKILDEQNIQIIGEQLFELVDVQGRKKILLDFKNVDYLSSAALGKLITLNKKATTSGGKLVLCNIRPEIKEVFEITKLDKFFKIKEDEQVGLQAFDYDLFLFVLFTKIILGAFFQVQFIHRFEKWPILKLMPSRL